MHIVRNFWRNESGATAIEYALIAALVAVVIIAGATMFGGSLNSLFGKPKTV